MALCENGDEVAVTGDNLREYVQAYVEAILSTSVEKQVCCSFLKCITYLRILTPIFFSHFTLLRLCICSLCSTSLAPCVLSSLGPICGLTNSLAFDGRNHISAIPRTVASA